MTEDVINNRLCTLIGRSTPVSFDEAVADVKRINISEPDARLRILLLQTSYLELCERLSLTFVENTLKAAFENLVEVFKPPSFKLRVKDALRLETRDLKDDFFGFADLLADEAEDWEKYHPFRAYRSSLQGNRRKGAENQKNNRVSSPGKGDKSKLLDSLNPDCNQKNL